MNFIEKIGWNFSAGARKNRAGLFRNHFILDEHTKILDLGSMDGTNIHNILQNTKVRNENVYIADLYEDAIKTGEKKFGFKPVLIDENDRLPFADKFFDIVYCSSVIEHVTISKADLWSLKNGKKFKAASRERQQRFAEEICRLGRQYFVQTPAKGFPVESHTWLPLVGYLPREMFLPVLKLSNRFWVKDALPDFNLLGKKDMESLFPDAEIIGEIKFGLTKSIMAIKSEKL